jgi:general secretion pathway protein L
MMKQVLFIRPASAPEDNIAWCESGSNDVAYLSGHEALSTLNEHPLADRVCLLLPASEMIFRRFTVAKKGLGASGTPFSWLAEETLIGDVDALHWTVMAKKGQQVDAVAIQTERLQQWMTLCQEAGLNVVQVLPDAILLPETPDGVTVVPVDENYWLRLTPFGAGEVDADLLPLVLAKNAGNDIVYYGEPESAIAATASQAWQHPLVLIQPQWKACKANMMHGPFARKTHTLNVKRLSKQAVAGVVLLLAAVIIPQVATAWLYMQQENRLQEDIQVLCQHHFPNMTQKSNLKYFFGQNLKKEKKGFFLQLDDLNRLKQAAPGVQVNSVEYDAGKDTITLTIAAQEPQALQQFVSQTQEQFDFSLQPISTEAPYTAIVTGSFK